MTLRMLSVLLLLAAAPGFAQTMGVAAVVNGDVITTADVENRRRLFAVSSGLQPRPEVLQRLGPQVLRQLVDERLRLQEAQRRRVSASDDEVAQAIANIERQNNMPPGAMRARLGAASIAYRTFVDQVRAQILWVKTLRQVAGQNAEPTADEIAERIRTLQAQQGRQEFRVAEIFIPVDDPSREAQVQQVVNDIIAQLRTGAPFPVVAAQFSQSQSSLQGGDLGWLQEGDMDPEVARVVTRMPERAISNPIRVAGGFSIVTLVAKRTVGQAAAPPPAAAAGRPLTILSIRQVFLPLPAPVPPGATAEQLTDGQRAVLRRAEQIVASARTCPAMEQANAAAGNVRPSNPGQIALEQQSGQMRQFLNALRPGQPIVANAGNGLIIALLCSRETRTPEPRPAPAEEPAEAQGPGGAGSFNRDQVSQLILRERLDLLSRQLMRDLRRRADIQERAA
jgi:peptidyl-prolyl cis-trans isomerase SurA